ncbi:glycosyltransferase [Uliginosibacterium sediminicola]|uniref:Glycosyltransferase n=1 Tax=Uliginosibacterium sediminicola TaxID=2024550 RepID=A0ABU9Z3A5_9RHOO
MDAPFYDDVRTRCVDALILVVGEVVGGHERQLLGIVQGLIAQSLTVEVVCSSRQVACFFNENGICAVTKNIFRLGKVWQQFRFARSYALEMKTAFNSSRLVLVSGGTVEACVALCRASKIANADNKVFAYVPMYINRSYAGRGVSRAYDFLLRALLRSVDRFITINKVQAALLTRFFRVPCSVVNNVVVPVSQKPPYRGQRLVFCGRLDDGQKNITGLISWLDTVENPYRELLIIGDGPDSSKVTQAASSVECIKIHMLGWVKPESIADVVSSGDLLVLNSRWEGEPMVVREFSGVGIPCVAPDIDGFRLVVPKKMRFSDRKELLSILSAYHERSISTPLGPCASMEFHIARRDSQLRRLALLVEREAGGIS